MPYIRINGVRYFYRRRGAQGAASLLLIHGFTGSSANWHLLSEGLSSRFNIVAVDLPGHGKTESPAQADRYAMDKVARDVVDIAEGLKLQQVNLLGYSMGGRLALHIAAHFPNFIKALVLESSSPGIRNRNERLQRREKDWQLAEAIEQESLSQFVDKWENLPLFDSQKALPAERREMLRKQRLTNNRHGLANSLRAMGTGSQAPLWGSLPHIQAQTLLICGDLDAKFVSISRRMAHMMPEATLRVIPGAGHNLHFERPKLFESMVADFISPSSAV